MRSLNSRISVLARNSTEKTVTRPHCNHIKRTATKAFKSTEAARHIKKPPAIFPKSLSQPQRRKSRLPAPKQPGSAAQKLRSRGSASSSGAGRAFICSINIRTCRCAVAAAASAPPRHIFPPSRAYMHTKRGGARARARHPRNLRYRLNVFDARAWAFMHARCRCIYIMMTLRRSLSPSLFRGPGNLLSKFSRARAVIKEAPPRAADYRYTDVYTRAARSKKPHEAPSGSAPIRGRPVSARGSSVRPGESKGRAARERLWRLGRAERETAKGETGDPHRLSGSGMIALPRVKCLPLPFR